MLKLHPVYFFISFAIGILYCYLTTPPPDVVLKFPSPINSGKITYKDRSDECYKYKANKIACPREKNKIKPQPINEFFKNK